MPLTETAWHEQIYLGSVDFIVPSLHRKTRMGIIIPKVEAKECQFVSECQNLWNAYFATVPSQKNLPKERCFG